MVDDEASEESFDAQLGRVIDGRYRLIDPLGEGGMGAVFVAEHLGLRKEVALKIVRPEHAGNAGLAARFTREAMVTAQVEHPNVVSATDCGTLEDGTAYLVTQLVRGQSLSQLVDEEGPLHWARAADIAAQIADALCAAKAHGIVHRDLKPENVLVQRGDDGIETVKVLDFGIAKYARDSLAPPPIARTQQVTQSGMVIGTPGYMAPEQAVGQRADHRSDLYALGVLAWECVVGRRLWTGEDPREIISNQLRNTPKRLRAASGDASIPLDFEELVVTLLANAPSGRPDDPSIVRDRLREIAAIGRMAPLPAMGMPRSTQGLPRVAPQTPAKDARATRPLRASPLPPRQTTPLTSDIPPRRQSWRWFWMSTAASVLLCAGYAFWASGFVQRTGNEGALVIAPIDELAPRLIDLAKRRGKPGKPAPVRVAAPSPTPTSGTGLPHDLEPQLALLVQGATREQRVEAARALLGHIPIEQTPPYVRALAHFQLAESCTDKREPFALLASLEDPRSLPVLVIASERAKNGCRRKDCLACIRPELERLIAQLETAGAAQPIAPSALPAVNPAAPARVVLPPQSVQ